MGIFQSDLTIKTMIDLSLRDMRKNPWLLDDIISDAVENPYLKDKYGKKQIDAFKEWFLNNEINIYMRDRQDKDAFPCVTITLGSSQEKEEMKHMADQSTESVQLLPQQINKPIPYVVKPFTINPANYDDVTGQLQLTSEPDGLDSVSPGMILVDPSTGKGYIIQDVGPDYILLEPDLEVTATSVGIVPKNQFYTARREHSFFQETYQITCHAHGDPQTLLWLWSVVIYSILRYRESMLEANGFTQSSVSSTSMEQNPFYTSAGGEIVWQRVITLTGMVENSWIKSPRRIIESVAVREKTGTVKGYKGGIKILSNSEPEIIDQDDENWYAIDSEDSENNES